MSSDDTLQWTVHLARRRPRHAIAAAVVIAAASLAAGLGFQSVFLGLLAPLLLVGSLADFLFPLRYTIGPDGAEVRGALHRRRMAWSQVKRVLRDDQGVKLSPLARRSRLEASRGIYLWFADNEQDVMASVGRHTEAERAGGDEPPPV